MKEFINTILLLCLMHSNAMFAELEDCTKDFYGLYECSSSGDFENTDTSLAAVFPMLNHNILINPNYKISFLNKSYLAKILMTRATDVNVLNDAGLLPTCFLKKLENFMII